MWEKLLTVAIVLSFVTLIWRFTHAAGGKKWWTLGIVFMCLLLTYIHSQPPVPCQHNLASYIQHQGQQPLDAQYVNQQMQVCRR